jgi:hypothetical protein
MTSSVTSPVVSPIGVLLCPNCISSTESVVPGFIQAKKNYSTNGFFITLCAGNTLSFSSPIFDPQLDEVPHKYARPIL